MKSTQRSKIALVFLLVFVVLLTACQTQTVAPTDDTGASAVDRSQDEYIYVSSMGNLEFFNAHKYGWAWAGEALGVTATYVGPAEYDMTAMVAAFDQAIAMQPKGIAVFGVEPILGPTINKAVEAGIPVVTILGDLPDTDRLAFVGSYQYDLGFIGGQNLAEALGGQGKIAVLSIPGVGMFDDREDGYRAAFEMYPGIEVVQVGDTGADTVTAINTAKDILQRVPDLAAFACTDSTGGIGAATAVEELNLVGDVKIVSMDRNSDVLEKIRTGVVTGTVAQNDAAMAFWALQVLYNYNYNQAPLTTDNEAAGVNAGPSMVFMAANYVDQSNLEYFLAANTIYEP
ncbi:MAG: substrate-binding domain-containing protein [Brevefilum sp.]|nr:substrate-binding domain-containing protein [Brevefilum sp.]